MKKRLAFGGLIALITLLTVTIIAFANGPEGNVTVSIAPDGMSFTAVGSNEPVARVHDWKVVLCDGTVIPEEGFEYAGWPHPNPLVIGGFGSPIETAVVGWHDNYGGSHEYEAVATRSCKPPAKPLFTMWLLTGPMVERAEPGVGYRGDGCMLISEFGHPSVERQNARCFPINDPSWTATDAPCAEPVYDDGNWGCDPLKEALGLERLPLYSNDGNDLWHVWTKYKANAGID